MKQINFRILIPHFIAIGIFLLTAVIFCKPALESDTILKQSDITGWQGMSHQSVEYKEKYGRYPLWAVSMFSGMPGYQIYMDGPWWPLTIVNEAMQLWLPKPMNFFFLACVCFYFLCLCLRIRPYAAICGALGFAYCTFSPIIITAGHDTQMFALAYAPAVLGSVILIFEKKFLSGFVLASLFTAIQIAQGHQQISYYLFMILLAVSLSYAVILIKARHGMQLMKSLALIAAAGIIGVLSNALVLFTAYDYAKDSKRGGQLVIDQETRKKDIVKDGKTAGLSKDYAFQWSYGKGETFSLMFPGVQGYGAHYAERDGEPYLFPRLDEKSNLAKYFTEKLNVPEDQAVNFAMQQSRALYWGGQPFTNGPVYIGAVICFLFIFGMFYLNNKHKWWILGVSLFAVLLAWGQNFAGFNYFMFDHLPLYNKFRVPTMTLVIPQILFPVVAALALNTLWDHRDDRAWKKLKQGCIATGIVFAAALSIYVSSDFSKENRQRTTRFNQVINEADAASESKLAMLDQTQQAETDNRIYEGMIANLKGTPQPQKTAREIIDALRKDRAALLLADIFRSLVFVLIAGCLIALYLRSKIKALVMTAGICLLTAIDLLGMGMKYLNEKSFDSKSNYEAAEFPQSEADQTILADTDPNFRVLNSASLEESKTSYYHKSIGGYHPAKLGIYDDLMAYQLSNSPNMQVLNMLNTKYVIQQRGDKLVAARNADALGNAWFVKGVKFVRGPVAEMKGLDHFQAADTAVIDEKFKSFITGFVPADSSSTIKMTTFQNDEISYQSNASASHLAVFSEIYYKDWKAYIDSKPAEIAKANYVLRALLIPAGKHKIEFKFQPAVYYTGRTIGNICTWLVALLFLGYIASRSLGYFRSGKVISDTRHT